MAFNTPTFLFLFLPLVLALFFALPRTVRTPWLVVASLVFYAWGEKRFVLLLVASALVNWLLALVLERASVPWKRRGILAAAVTLNIGALVYFKYTNFFVGSLNELLAPLGPFPLDVAPVHLPIGVSFVTFEALSYVVDVYRGKMTAARNPLHVACFLSFFPHLIAGPILRFRDMAGAMAAPAPTLAGFDSGVSRFVAGLAKKTLLANPLGSVADHVFALAPGELTTGTAWLGIVCFALQIYFDFSGYSDMAIGLGRMLGFSLPENFRLPYAADSIRDFWRRWHITLSSWFRDYLFIPLGGSRRGAGRTYFNLLAVFLLCGLWHGASWNFALWGLFHGTFLVLERLRFGQLLAALPWPLRRAYTLAVVLAGWVLFRAESLPQAWNHLVAMSGAGAAQGPAVAHLLTRETLLALVAATLLSTVSWPQLLQRGGAWRSGPWRRGWPVMGAAAELVLFVASLAFVAAGTSSSFIYFRF